MPKFGRKVPHLRCDTHTSFKVKWSKVRVRGGRCIPHRLNLAATLLVKLVNCLCSSGFYLKLYMKLYVATLSFHLTVQLSWCLFGAIIGSPCGRAALARESRPAVHAGKSIPVSTWTPRQAGQSIPCKNGIVRRAGSSIIQMVLRGHQMIADGLRLSS